jgi:hypothetical protein
VGEPAWIIGLVFFTTFVDLHYGNGEIWIFVTMSECVLYISTLSPLDTRRRVW